MSAKRTGFILFTMLALLLGACSPGGEVAAPTQPSSTGVPAPAAAGDEPTAEAPVAGDACPVASDDTYLLRNPRHGYCLLYPTTHKVERPNADEVDLVIGGLLNATDPRASIRVMAADGRSAAAYADEIVAGFTGFDFARSEATIAGEPAVVLDNLPGQDINRQVIFTHEGQLYHLYFSPIDPANPPFIDDFARVILDSFTFMPVSETVTAADECVAPKADQQAVVSEAFGFCVLVPADFTYEESSATNGNVFFGSMMDVEHPKLMIEVTDAAGRTSAEAADELVASVPDIGVQRSFGDTLGYEPADRLDAVPGQDLGRVLLAVHHDRLYRLTFVPDDPAQAGVYEQMEALFAQVLATWRFLP